MGMEFEKYGMRSNFVNPSCTSMFKVQHGNGIC